MQLKLQVVFYSMYGHMYHISEAIVEGARSVKNVEVTLFRVPELMPEPMLEQSGAKAAQEKFLHVPVIQPKEIASADAYLFGASTRFGNISSQMRHFLDQMNGSLARDKFAGKIGSVYTSYEAEQEASTLANCHTTLFHLGMVVVGAQQVEKIAASDLTYGARTPACNRKRMPSDKELNAARYQGKQVAEIALALKRGKGELYA